MTVWVVRAGAGGEQEEFALAQNCAVIDWPDVGNVGRFRSWEELRAEVDRAYPAKPLGTRTKWTGEIWNFARVIEDGDLIVLPLKKRPDGVFVESVRRDGVVAVGECVGKYEHVADGPSGTEHRREVRWIKRNIPRAAFDIPDNLEKRQTVFPLESPQSEKKIRATIVNPPLERRDES